MKKMMISIAILMISTSLFASYGDLKRNQTPKYLEQAFGSLEQTPAPRRSPWPFDILSIGHTMSSYQLYSSSLGSAYFHHGLDIRGNTGTPVLSSTSGKVVNIENYAGGPLYWEVAILDDNGFLWQYHHVDKDSITQKMRDSYKWGERIEAGEKIGEIVDWPVYTGGEQYSHVHLNILDNIS